MKLTGDDGHYRLQLPAGPNAIDRPWLDAFRDALARVAADGQARSFVSVGTPAGYCSGYDMAAFRALSRAERRQFIADYRGLLRALFDLPAHTVAWVPGPAVGAGVLIALAHDHRWVTREAGRFTLPEIDARIPIQGALMDVLRARLPGPSLRTALLEGRSFAGEAARDSGFATGVARREGEVAALCAQVASGDPPHALPDLRRAVEGPWLDQLAPGASAVGTPAPHEPSLD